jgi:hypothetical protein
MIFDGDPGVDRDFKRVASVSYRAGFSKAQVAAAHRELSTRVDKMGQEGAGLDLSVVPVLNEFVRRGIVEPGTAH